MASWRRCDRCRRVLPGEEFDGDSPTCRACLTVPVKPVRAPASAGQVTTRRTAPRPAAAARPAPAATRPALLGSTGSGDLEVRERRARRSALESLATSHPEEFALLLRDARAKEGLRASAPPPTARDQQAEEPSPPIAAED